MRRLVLACVVAAVFVGCGGPRLREPTKVKPKAARAACGEIAVTGVDRGQARCIAGLAGLNTAEGAHELREARTVAGEEIWLFEEVCDRRNPECISVEIRRSDGKLLDTRYLYVFDKYR